MALHSWAILFSVASWESRIYNWLKLPLLWLFKNDEVWWYTWPLIRNTYVPDLLTLESIFAFIEANASALLYCLILFKNFLLWSDSPVKRNLMLVGNSRCLAIFTLPLWQHNLNSPFLPSDSKFNEPQYLHLNSNLPWKVTLSEKAFSKGLN